MTQLDALPPEILFNILSFTEPSCNPTLTSFPLCAVAATNRCLNAIAEEYARGLLKKHADFKPRKSSKTFSCRRKWLAEICQFCKKGGKRRAILYPTLTCCPACDREQFPKITMTTAMKTYYLSKLDLFTPNKLHRDLPPLTVRSFYVSGVLATMILETDVLARCNDIYALLGPKAHDNSYMRKRPTAHDRIAMHLGLRFNHAMGRWARNPTLLDTTAKTPNSMKTPESRGEYVKRALEKEWAAMGMNTGGTSKDTAIELE